MALFWSLIIFYIGIAQRLYIESETLSFVFPSSLYYPRRSALAYAGTLRGFLQRLGQRSSRAEAYLLSPADAIVERHDHHAIHKQRVYIAPSGML